MASPLVFSVTRREPVLVTPAKPTPHEFKPLSDIDDQETFRFQIPVIQFYHNDTRMGGRDPAGVVRDALAKVLVFYYPFAGRLREWSGRKLIVECTGEGVLFVEADADVRLEQLGETLHPPFPWLDKFLYEVPGTGEILNCPLLLIQVTRLSCGGFIFVLRLNHTMSDGFGVVQFMRAVGEIARGASTPSVLPVWHRELFSARNPPHVTHTHREYDKVVHTNGTINIPFDNMVHGSFFFGPQQVSALRKQLPPHLRTCSTFDLLIACLWRCRTIALGFNADEEVRMLCAVNARGKFNPPLPDGYYGNALSFPAAISRAGKLCENPLGYALELVRKAKAEMNEAYMQSLADFMVAKGRPPFQVVGTYLVSDVRYSGFEDIDFGWGRPVYGGVAEGVMRGIQELTSFYIPFGDGIVVPFYLPSSAMEKLRVELHAMTTQPKAKEELYDVTSKFTISRI
ncbi:benzyl alcohol O-benzoyltransferase-like [Tasmannia lanceolata]|uniref:benzyl alcohol O-benzoyltransferase-like n=1 Tax=Tasmannia lanceolata TaxID=3420 RepID=UPI004062828A